MFFTKMKIAATFVLVLALIGGGVGLVVGRTPTDTQPIARPAQPQKQEAAKAETKDAVQPKELLKQAVEAAQTIDDQTYKVWVLINIASAQMKSNEKDAAAKTFAAAIEVVKLPASQDGFQKDHRLRDIAEAQAKAGDFKGALDTADTIDQDDAQAGARSAIAIAKAQASDIKGAEETIASITSDVRKGEATRALVAAQIKAGMLGEAAKTAEGITHDLSRVVASLALSDGYRTAKDGKAAEKHLQDARKVVEAIVDNEETDTRAVADGALAEALAAAGNVKGARMLAGGIKKLMWKWIALGRVTDAQARAGDFMGAMETARTIEDESDRDSAMKNVLTAQLGAGDIKGALKTLEAMKRPYWRAEALIEIAKAQAKTGDAAAATKSFGLAFEEAGGVEEMEGTFGNAFNACHVHVVRALAETGREKEAAAWAAARTAPLQKAQALLGVLEGMRLRKEAGKPGAKKN